MIHLIIELGFAFTLFMGLIYCIIRIARLEDRLDRHWAEIDSLRSQPRGNASPPPFLSQSSPPPMPPPQSPTRENTPSKIERTLQNPTMSPEENKEAPVEIPAGNIPAATELAPVSEPAPTVPQYFYMSGPMTNYFPPTAKSMTKENTLYKFTVYGDGQTASFELHTEGAPVKEFIRAKDSYIKPACNELNFPPSNVKNIATITPGKAALEGDKWLIITKALVKYE